MVYISEAGNVLENRSPWRLTIIPDFFWGICEFISLFFRTLIQPDLTKHGLQSSVGSGGNRRPPPPPGRRFGGFGSGFSSNYRIILRILNTVRLLLLRWAVDEEDKRLMCNFTSDINKKK
uniref:Selenoprotein K n=1 Tax=Strigamia maritima TaxID=126957 RepID=T1JNY6_STRMM